MYPIPNGFQGRAISLYTVQTSNTPCPHTSCKVHWCWRRNFRKMYSTHFVTWTINTGIRNSTYYLFLIKNFGTVQLKLNPISITVSSYSHFSSGFLPTHSNFTALSSSCYASHYSVLPYIPLQSAARSGHSVHRNVGSPAWRGSDRPRYNIFSLLPDSACFLLGLLFHLEDGGDMFLQKSDYTALFLRK
jgi:hypothetical protein